jgi:hypothetical protein
MKQWKRLKLITMIIPMTTKMDLDEDDLDMFEGDDSFEDFGFEENWN